jgi:hypothetical protein
MKRLIRFFALFGLGLLAFALALGPGRLFKRGSDATISATDVGDVDSPIAMRDRKNSIGVALHGAGSIPFWRKKLLPDGSTLSVKPGLISYDGIESFSGGFHFTKPVIELYPGKETHEHPTARLSGGAADVAIRGATSELGQLSEAFEIEDVREFTISSGAKLEMLDEQGAVEVTLETERLESPESALDEEGAPVLAAKLVAPGPVHLWRADQSLDLHAGAMEIDRVSGRLTLLSPLTVTGGDATLTADGPATFTRKAAPAGAARPKGSEKAAAAELLRPEQLVGPGDLLFTRNVLVKQGDRWLRSDRVAVEVGQDPATKKSQVVKLDAGTTGRAAPVTLGLLGGEGSAAGLHWSREENALRLDGPVELHDLLLGEGREAKRLKLSAAQELVAHELAPDGGAASRVTIELKKGARAEIPGELTANADRLFATLQPADEKTKTPARLVSVDLESALDARDPANVDLAGRGKARARKVRVRVVEEGAGGHVAHLEGDARVDAERGFVTGETIDVVAPADPKAASRITVPALGGGELSLPAGGSLFADPSAGGAAPDRSEAVARKLVLEPLGTCALTIEGHVVDVVGRCRYRVRAAAAEAGAPDLQSIVADELHLKPREPAAPDESSERLGASGGEELDVRALGDVVFDDLDPANPVHAEAALASTERTKTGARRLVLEGAPASITFALPRKEGGAPAETDATSGAAARDVTASAAKLVLDLERGNLVADDESQRVTIELPEPLLAELLPSVRSAVATKRSEPASGGEAAPARLLADHLEITPGEGATRSETLQNGRLHAWGRVGIERPSSGGTVRCRELALDLARRSARLDGDAKAPVVLEEPKPYDRARVESLTATWIEARRGGAEIDVAPNAFFVLHPEDEPTPSRPVPPLLKVTIQASDAPQLRGRQLLFGGGVETTLTRIRKGQEERGTARSERAELLLDRPLDQRDAAMLKFNASQRVRVDYGDFRAEGALLSFDFATRWLTMKEGIEPCTLLGKDPKGDWRGISRFRVMRVPVKDEASLDPNVDRFQIEGLEMIVEGPRGSAGR